MKVDQTILCNYPTKYSILVSIASLKGSLAEMLAVKIQSVLEAEKIFLHARNDSCIIPQPLFCLSVMDFLYTNVIYQIGIWYVMPVLD